MRYFLIMSHGRLADGILDSLTMLMGKLENVTAISAYTEGDQDIQADIDKHLKLLEEKDELIIFTDILGGSINNNAMLFLDDPRVHLITGVNLAVIAEIITANDITDTISVIEEAIILSREALVYCNTKTQYIQDEDF